MEGKMAIKDMTELSLSTLRTNIYLEAKVT
jgi:hypothetical protein